MSWNDIYETCVREKGEQAIASKWLHNKSAMQYRIADSVLSGLIAIMSFSIGFFENEYIFSQSVKYISFSVGLIALMQRLVGFSGAHSRHKATSVSYDDVVNRVSTELAKPRDERDNVTVFIREITNEMNNANKNAPHVYWWVIKSFYKKFEHLNIAKPATVEQLAIIIVNDKNKNNDEKLPSGAKTPMPTGMKTPRASASKPQKPGLIASELDSHIIHKQISTYPSYLYEMSRFQQEESSEENSMESVNSVEQVEI